ncbi:Mhp1p KNAG_0H02280 [Huiozyma naganishii CBS 8797]|uniref:Uncharacterized protein n=1 Tax=Huiozyma naganishii (strain ATCC MYA-139 / BCRC 22969 / CBS 8797 / KCTC 17520 / NBRC 10181 / NCYC 3082 / Yp74L-3) TaxID=1071383 RepID=J7S1U3_HUIN7|nr:hypothetical protein KNAG_0H02280 [Kazachstania naganishii CBS 8797]CCK71642.1 hypothetical protein KNAG_0H02280 [Kazachstania naganishii CBS 8797]
MDSKDTQHYFREHNLPSLDVDWLMGCKKRRPSAGSKGWDVSGQQQHGKSNRDGEGERSEDPTPTRVHVPHADAEVCERVKRRNSIPAELENGGPRFPFGGGVASDETSLDSANAHHLRKPDGVDPAAGARRVRSMSVGDTEDMRMRAQSVEAARQQQQHKPEKKPSFFKSLFGGGHKKHVSTSSSIPVIKPRRPSIPHVSRDGDTAHRTRYRENRGESPSASTTSSVSSLQRDGRDAEVTWQGRYAQPSTGTTTTTAIPPDMTPLTKSQTASATVLPYHSTPQDHHHHHHHHHDQHGTIREGEEASNFQGLGTTATNNSSDSIISDEQEDPRLIEFLKYYKSKNYAMSAFSKVNFNAGKAKQNSGNVTLEKLRKPGKASFSIDEHLAEGDHKNNVRFDSRGRPIPAHPDNPKLPSAFKKVNRNKKSHVNPEPDKTDDSSTTLSSVPQSSSSNKFGAFLKRVTSYGAGSSTENMKSDESIASTSGVRHHTVSQFDASAATTVPGLEDLGTFKHVAFAANTYFNDPPQQICSKNPRKGEVEVKPNGSVVIHRLTPQEKRRVLKEYSSGIVVGGTGQLKLLVPMEADSEVDLKKQEEQVPIRHGDSAEEQETPTKTETESEVSAKLRNMKLAAAEAAAEARAKETPNDLNRTATNNEEEVSVSKMASHLTIDKPMVSRRSSSNILSSSNSSASLLSHESDSANAEKDEIFPPPTLKIPHQLVYTRCCHLREILPIPAILKQLKPGSTDPIPLLQLRNPRPSMVEILSFSDFISIAPISCISLDGVHLTAEMFQIILSSLMFKPTFEKLSLRNTPLDSEGWKILSYFISKCKSLLALDLTMVPHIKTNVQKPSKSSLKNKLPRMECHMEDRSDMNWHLIAGAIAFREGLEEIIVSGAKMTFAQLKTFIEVACGSTTRLGLAYNDLSAKQCEILANWIVYSRVTGLDIGFNNLKGKLAPFSAAIWNKIYGNSESNEFKYLSLNGTQLEVNEHDTSENNDFLKLLSILCYSENLKFLDLSNNPLIFPACIPTLLNCLPIFVSLLRLHIDYENITTPALVTLAECLPLCKQLSYLSVLGTELDLASCKALVEAFKKSKTLITLDVDYIYMPDSIKEKISLYAIRNIQTQLERVRKNATKEQIKQFNETHHYHHHTPDNDNQIQTLQDELANLLTVKRSTVKKEVYDKMVEEFVKKAELGREKIRKVVQDLFSLRMEGELNLEGKETLIRLCFIDASLEKGIKLLENTHSNTGRARDTVRGFGSVQSLSDTSTSDVSTLNPRETVLSSPSFGNSGHVALLPFGNAQIDTSHRNAEDTIEFRDNGPTALVDPLSVKPENGNGTAGEQDEETVVPPAKHAISPEEKDTLVKAAKSMDSDQVKEFLLKNDVSTVISVIDELHKQGFHLHHIFKKDATDKGDDDTDSPISDEQDAPASKGTTEPEESAHRMDHNETEAIDAAYDQVLDHLQKVRTSAGSTPLPKK